MRAGVYLVAPSHISETPQRVCLVADPGHLDTVLTIRKTVRLMSSGSARDSGLPGPGPAQGQGSPLSPEPQRTRFRAVSYPRKRAVTACEGCRIRKTKCDNERPRCTTCVKNDLSCSYDTRLGHSSWVSPRLETHAVWLIR